MQEIILYQDTNGKVKIEVLIQNETLWLPQAKIAELFGVDRIVVKKHLKNNFETNELEKIQYVQKLHILPKTVRIISTLQILSIIFQNYG